MINNREKLRKWQQEQKGLKDISFFPGKNNHQSIEQLANNVYNILSENCDSVDVTDEIE